MLSLVLQYFQPVVVIFVTITPIVAFLLGAFMNPQGAWNQIVVGAIDHVSAIFPSTPDEFKLINLVNQVADGLPLFGQRFVFNIFRAIGVIGGLSIVIKIYKLIPFKFS